MAITSLRNLDRAVFMHKSASFYAALGHGRDLKTTDRRGKVFDVLHLCKDDKKLDLDANYKQTIVDVYLAAITLLLNTSDDLRFLALSTGLVEER